MQTDTSVEKAQQLLLDHLPPRKTETVSVLEANGRTLAEDIFAGYDLPAASQSAVDGYALGEGNLPINSTVQLKGQLGAGEVPEHRLEPGEAIGVLTGGSLPPNCQAVVPQEKTSLAGLKLELMEQIKPGQNIKQAGEDFSSGDLLLSVGQKIDPGAVALLSAFGINQITVFSKPRVGILSLGANIVSWEEEPKPGQVRDSNTPMLLALIGYQGGLAGDLEIAVADDNTDLSIKLRQMMAKNDIVICTGGSYFAAGSEAATLFQAAGAQIFYWDVPIQPGSHTGGARYEDCMLFALSGNPAACFVGYQLFVAPVLLAMQGLNPGPVWIKAKCTNEFSKKTGSRRLVRGRAEYTSRGWEVTILPGQKPSMLRSLINCNALIDLSAGHPPLDEGMEVSVILLNNNIA